MNVTKDYMQELCNEFDITTYTSRKSPNTDRFKFRVWKPDWKQYDNDNYLSQDGVLVYAEVDGDGYSGLFCDGDDGVIEQCTGLKDKNGRLIYEGDVVEYTFSEGSKRQWFIVFDENLLQFSQCLISGDKTFPFSSINKETALKKEIVGNIHEPKWGIESDDDKSYKTNKSYGDEGKSEVKG